MSWTSSEIVTRAPCRPGSLVKSRAPLRKWWEGKARGKHVWDGQLCVWTWLASFPSRELIWVSHLCSQVGTSLPISRWGSASWVTFKCHKCPSWDFNPDLCRPKPAASQVALREFQLASALLPNRICKGLRVSHWNRLQWSLCTALGVE